MKAPLYLLTYFSLLLVTISCKDEPSQKSFTSRSSPIEVKTEENQILTDSDEIQDLLETGEFTLHRKELLSEIYTERGYEPIWNSIESRQGLFRNIEEIEYEGLFFEDYHGREIRKLLNNISENTSQENTRLEILLTDAFLRLTEDLVKGKLDPTKIYDIWGTPLNEVDSKALLLESIKKNDFQRTIDSIKPENPVYSGLKEALREFKKAGIEEDSISEIPTGKLIRPGEKDDRLNLIAKRLEDLEYLDNYTDSSFIYKPRLQKALQQFQQDHGLLTDGLIGTSTVRELNLSRRERYHQILLNMERWRWYPRDLGDHYILANIPAYELWVVKDGDTVMNHKTMVGTEARKTPVFSDEIAHIVYNPTWTVPPTIKKNDVLPGARKDPNYIKRKGFQVLDGSNNPVDPSSIDWSSSQARNYTFRQMAGPSNPLGLVKIIYPNQYMIYLHDTPSKELFNQNARAQSSGCVRVQNALDLARYLLSDQEKYGDKRINEIIKSGRTTEIPVTQKVKVHHFYWTAFVENNRLKFIHDVYNLDRPLWEKLKPAD